MKLFLKVIKISLLTVASVLVILALAGWLLQDRITDYALEEIRNSIDAPLGIEKARFSLISDFPAASVQFDDLWLGAYNKNENGEIESIDTLARVHHLYLSLDVQDLYNEIFTIVKVVLEDGYVNYYLDENGLSSYDSFVDSDASANDESTQPLDLIAEDISMKNITVHYKDDQQKTEAKIILPKLQGLIKQLNPKPLAQLNGDMIISNLYLDGTQLHRMQKVDVSLDVMLNSDTLEIERLIAKTDEFSIASDGRLIMGEDLHTDINVNASATSLSAIIKYIPDEQLANYQLSQVAGAIAINAKIRGFVSDDRLPHYTLDLRYDNGSVKWNDYPLVYNIGMQLRATNGSANNNATTTVDISKFQAGVSGSNLELKATINNLDELNYNLSSTLDINLDAAQKLIPDSLNLRTRGKIQAKISVHGNKPDTINRKFINALLKNTEALVYFDEVILKRGNDVHIKNLSAKLDYRNRKLKVDSLNFSYPDFGLRIFKSNFKVVLKGNVLRPKSTTLKIPSFRLASNRGTIKGSASIKKLKQVSYSLKSKLKFDLKQLRKFVSDTLVTDMKGKVAATISSKGKFNLNKIESQLEPILYQQTDVDLTLKKIQLDMADSLFDIQNLNGRLTKNKDQINISELKGVYQGIDFNVQKTTIENVFKTVLQNQSDTLKVDGTLRLGDLDYAILGAFAGGDESGKKNKPTEPAPAWHYDIKGKLFANSFKYDNAMVRDIITTFDVNDATEQVNGKLTISNITYDNTLINGFYSKYRVNTTTNEIKGKLSIKDVYYEDAVLSDVSALYNIGDSVYTIDKMTYNAFNGKISTSAKFTFHKNDEIEIEMQNDIDHIDMRKLMSEMKNFYQNEITHKNFSGQLSSDNLFLRMVMIGDSIVYDDLRMTADLKFENGGIYRYAPVQEMANYLPKVDNLDTMRFKTIDTHMFVFKDAIYVPNTYVVTSVFDVEALGQQSFGEDFQYHVGVNVFQVLGKNKKFDLTDEGPIKKKKMVRRLVTGRNGEYLNENSNGSKRDEARRTIKSKEQILKFKFHPNLFDFSTGAEDI